MKCLFKFISLLALQFLTFHMLIALALNLRDAYAVHNENLCANTKFSGKIMEVQHEHENGIQCRVKLGSDGKVSEEGISSDTALCSTLSEALRRRSARGCVCYRTKYENLSRVGGYPSRFCINGKIIVVNIVFYTNNGVEFFLGK